MSWLCEWKVPVGEKRTTGQSCYHKIKITSRTAADVIITIFASFPSIFYSIVSQQGGFLCGF
jgi:hypothetical protein